MTAALEMKLLGQVVKNLTELGSSCGETHIQKTAYVAKYVFYVPFDSKFILYKHGPYSFDLNGTLNYMRGQNILFVAPQGNYGSSYSLNAKMWPALARVSGEDDESTATRLRSVCTQFARKKVVELERIATAIYVRLNFATLDLPRQVDKLHELKPHIGLAEAKLAFEEAGDFF